MSICKHCNKPLSQSQYKSSNTYKSCPRCSTKNGQEHIFYTYPDNFGTSKHRISDNYPDGPQSHCQICRGGNDGPHHSHKKCSELYFLPFTTGLCKNILVLKHLDKIQTKKNQTRMFDSSLYYYIRLNLNLYEHNAY